MLDGYSILNKSKNSNSYLNTGARKIMDHYKTQGLGGDCCKYDYSRGYWVSLTYSQSFLTRQNFLFFVKHSWNSFCFPFSLLASCHSDTHSSVPGNNIRL